MAPAEAVDVIVDAHFTGTVMREHSYRIEFLPKGSAAVKSEVCRISGVQPSGHFVSLSLERPQGSSFRLQSESIVRIVDCETGEIVDEPTTWCLLLWLDHLSETSGGIPLDSAINALPITGLGEETCWAIASAARTWDEFWRIAENAAREMEIHFAEGFNQDDVSGALEFASYKGCSDPFPTLSRLLYIDLVGIAKARRICEAVGDPQVRIVRELVESRFRVLDHQEPAHLGGLQRLTIAFTGQLSSLSRAEAKRLAKHAGAFVVDSISEDLDYLVVGGKPGQKARKAEVTGVKIIGEEEFLRLCRAA